MTRLTTRRTLLFSLAAIALVAAALQVGRALRHQLRSQHDRTLPHVLDRRGTIYDAAGTSLTKIEERQSAWLDVTRARTFADRHPATWQAFCAAMALALDADGKSIAEAVTKPKAFAWIKRQLPADRRQRLETLLAKSEWREIAPSVRLVREPVMTYPYQGHFQPLLGFVGLDGEGLEGLQRSYDRWLAGTREDGRGGDLYLSMNLQTQGQVQKFLLDWYAEKEQEQWQSLEALVLRVPDARVVAVVSLPNADANNIQASSPSSFRLRPVSDYAQLGPMVLPFLAAGGTENYDDFLAESFRSSLLHPGKATGRELTRSLGLKESYAALKRFKLGEKTGSDYAGEIGGNIIRPLENTDYLLDELGDGSGIATSLLRYALSFNALINGGELHGARFVEKYRPAGGAITPIPQITPHRAIEPETSAAMRRLLADYARRNRPAGGNDLGGFWAVYDSKDRLPFMVRRYAAAALFTPLDKPEYLIVLRAQFGRNQRIDRNLAWHLGSDIAEIVGKHEKASPGGK